VEKRPRGGQATDDNTTGLMRFPRWIAKTTKTLSEYVILVAFPRQEWLRERTSTLRYTDTACPVSISNWSFHE
jgi:hypothetical protein